MKDKQEKCPASRRCRASRKSCLELCLIKLENSQAGFLSGAREVHLERNYSQVSVRRLVPSLMHARYVKLLRNGGRMRVERPYRYFNFSVGRNLQRAIWAVSFFPFFFFFRFFARNFRIRSIFESTLLQERPFLLAEVAIFTGKRFTFVEKKIKKKKRTRETRPDERLTMESNAAKWNVSFEMIFFFFF